MVFIGPIATSANASFKAASPIGEPKPKVLGAKPPGRSPGAPVGRPRRRRVRLGRKRPKLALLAKLAKLAS